jgi:hypothetical protein
MREAKVALRRLRQQPWFATAAVVTLALGIAAPTTLFALVDATLACGVLLAWWMGTLMGKYVYQVSATNAAALGGAAMVVLAVAIAATLPAARRAALIAPADALKS